VIPLLLQWGHCFAKNIYPCLSPYSFVLFDDDNAVEKVLNEKTHSLKNKKIDPKRAEARGGKEPIRKVFVGGVAVELPEEDIRKHFGQFGEVAEIEFPFNKLKNERKGFCFVTFADVDACDKAAAEPKQTLGGKQCDVKKAIPKEDPRSWSDPGYYRGTGRGRGRGGRGGYGGGYGHQYNYGEYYGQYVGNGYPGYNNNYYYDYYGPQYGYAYSMPQHYGYNQQQQQPIAK
jgi:RNA recognition motif-containing protein